MAIRHSILFLIGGIFSLMVAMGIGRFAYTPLLPLMQEGLNFSDVMAGYLASSNYGGYLVGAILIGMLPTKNYKTLYLRISLLASILTTFMMGITDSYILMLVIRFVSGVASAFIFVCASSIVLDKLANSGKTNWAGYFYSGVGFGIFFSTLTVPKLNGLFMWQGVWIGLAVISSLLTIFVWFWLKDSPNVSKTNEQLITRPTPPLSWLSLLTIAYGLEGLGYIVTGTFIVSIAEKTAAFTINSSIVWIVVGLGAIPSCIIWSTLGKKYGFVKSLVFAMLLQSLSIALPVFLLSQYSLLISALFFGATFMGITTLVTSLARQMKPINSSQIIGQLTAVYAAGQMIGPTIAGYLFTYTQSFESALIGAASAIFLGAILLISGIRYERIPNMEIVTIKSNGKRDF